MRSRKTLRWVSLRLAPCLRFLAGGRQNIVHPDKRTLKLAQNLVFIIAKVTNQRSAMAIAGLIAIVLFGPEQHKPVVVRMIETGARLVPVAIDAFKIERGGAHVSDRAGINPHANRTLRVQRDIVIDEPTEEGHAGGSGPVLAICIVSHLS